ncbi:MAG: hypothetical protein P8H59_05415 [Flavobacteriales bacterium]|nr:hypothetical protein [Flavobacteriales bacterium]MDG1780369.1 hypothetical protein [Flavobacteriales bacterium]MDG2246565.1 hypothetical protein [Flavobacteriales bacterium]
MKRFFKFLGYLLLFSAIAGVIAYFYYDEPVPEGSSGIEADRLAEKMLEALSYDDWQNTRYVTWSFRGEHNYVWDKENNQVQVSWDGKSVLLSTQNPFDNAIVTPANSAPEIEEKAIKDAWSYFCNDSFWLIAPYKLFDPGVTRGIVKSEDGKEGLMITYGSGGVTPGDSYLWHLDAHHIPTSYQMWVEIIPVGGIEATWDNWIKTATGAFISTSHSIGGTPLELTNVKTAQTLSELNLEENLFKGLK